MTLFSSPYELQSFQALNSASTAGIRHGVLLKIKNQSDQEGYSDLHPWPELGDPTLSECLKDRGPLFQRAVEIAQMDLEARAQGILLNPGRLISHRLIRNLKAVPKDADERAVFKLKWGAQLDELTPKLKLFMSGLRSLQKVRIDFNESLSAEAFDQWLANNAEWLLGRLDFIEDPAPFDASVYNRWKEVLAFDRVAIPDGFMAAVKIVKPARENIQTQPAFLENRIQRIVFTHNMDHPLGQRAARVCASQFYEQFPDKTDVGGLENFDGYHLRDENISHPEDHETGLGLNHYLSERTWTPI